MASGVYKFLKRRLIGAVGSLFVLVDIFRWLMKVVGWGGDLDFLITRSQDPGWVGTMARIATELPIWNPLVLSIMGLSFIFIDYAWNVRRPAAKLSNPRQPKLLPDRPLFEIMFDNAAVFVPTPGQLGAHLKTAIAMDVKVWNLGSPGHIVQWILHVTPINEQPDILRAIAIANDIRVGGSPAIIIERKESLIEKCEKELVGTTLVRGKILFLSTLEQAIVADANTRWSLIAIDSHGRESRYTARVGDLPRSA